MTKDQKIAKLGKEITDRATVLLGKDKITPNSPEYLGINSALKYTAYKYDQKMADDILDICLTMKKRVPLSPCSSLHRLCAIQTRTFRNMPLRRSATQSPLSRNTPARSGTGTTTSSVQSA